MVDRQLFEECERRKLIEFIVALQDKYSIPRSDFKGKDNRNLRRIFADLQKISQVA